MSSALPSGLSDSPRADDWGLGPYDSGQEDVNDSDSDVPVISIPSSPEPTRVHDFYAASRVPQDDDIPVGRSDYYDSLYVGQNTEENLEIQDNGLFGQTIGDLTDSVPPDPYEAGVLSSIIQTLFEHDNWDSNRDIRRVAHDLSVVIRFLHTH